MAGGRQAAARSAAEVTALLAAAGVSPGTVAATIFGTEEGICAELFRRQDGERVGLAVAASPAEIRAVLREAGILNVGEDG